MKKPVLGLLMIASLGCTQVLAADTVKQLRVGVEGAYPPFSEKAPDGSLKGFDIDIAYALCTHMEVKCVLVETGFDSMIPSLNVRDDADLLDSLAGQAYSRLDPTAADAQQLADLPPALRRRVWLRLAAAAGCAALTKAHVEALDALVMGWRGQGPVDLPGGVAACRDAGRILWEAPRTPHR